MDSIIDLFKGNNIWIQINFFRVLEYLMHKNHLV